MQNSPHSLIKRLSAWLAAGLLLPQALQGMDVQVKQQQVETTQQQASDAKPEVLVTLITSQGKEDQKSFSVPLSFIKASRLLNSEYQGLTSPLGNDDTSTEATANAMQNAQQSTIALTTVSSDVFALIEPHCALIGRLHELRKLRHHLYNEITFVNSSGLYASTYDAADGEPEKERRNKELFFAKYPTIKTFTLHECKSAIAALRAQLKVLNQERAEIYTTLYFALRLISFEQLQDLMLMTDFCEIKTLDSFLISLAFRLTDEERAKLPEHLLEKVTQKKAGKRASLLHWACSRGMLAVAEDLFPQSLSSFSLQNCYGDTPLNCAAAKGHAAIIQARHSYACLAVKQVSKLSLDQVYHTGTKILSSISRDFGLPNNAGYTPILTACRFGETEAVKVLLEQHANVNDTTLHHACCNKETAELIYNKLRSTYSVIHLDARDAESDTPLLKAIKLQSEDTVRFLLEKGANKRAADQQGSTALHMACDYPVPALSLVQALVEAECPLNVTDVNGMTPFHCACTQNSLPVVRFLTQQNGVDLHQKARGKTPLELAASYRRLAVVQFLFEECGCGFEDLKDQTFASYSPKIRAYLEEQKAAITRRAREHQEEQDRLRARRELQKRGSK